MSNENWLTQKDLEEVLQSLANRLNASQGDNAFTDLLFHPVRWQHFYFVHQYLADRLEWEADNALEDLLCSDSATEQLRALWLSVGEKEKASGDDWILADEVECFPFHPNDEHRGVIVRFPEPQHTCEAYFAAMIFSSDMRVRDFVTYYRYFILELSVDLDGSKRTVLCERGYGRHYNYGDGCEPQREAFETLIRTKFFGPGTFAPKLDS